MNTWKFPLAAAVALTLALGPAAATTLYSDRTAFENQLDDIVIDGYDAPDYGAGLQILNDAEMSAALGETRYTSTGFPDHHLRSGSLLYCSGCNGSYLLDFSATSVGTSDGVFGVGLDVADSENVYGTFAFVTFGDGSTDNFSVPDVDAFWGLTSDLLINTIHFGLSGGGTNTQNSVQRMAMDNLTIGSQASVSVPAPAPVALMVIGFAGMVYLRGRRG